MTDHEPTPGGEFGLIARHFTRPTRRAVLGVGDDCALLAPRAGCHWAVSSDMLVEGRHFVSTVEPARLGHKALAVNLSDLAACGATPVAYTLALALPRVDDAWLVGFAGGLHALADAHGIELVGGDTTAGPLNVCITVFGEVPAGAALRRDGARDGDTLWVSHPLDGGLGDARLALEVLRGTLSIDGLGFEAVRRRMEQPTPRVALGEALRGVACAAIDLSDGLLGDLGHVVARSGVGAVVDEAALPCSRWVRALPAPWRRVALLAGGDDYELLFAAPPAHRAAVEAAAVRAGCAVTAIGRCTGGDGVVVHDADGGRLDALPRAFDHFAAP